MKLTRQTAEILVKHRRSIIYLSTASILSLIGFCVSSYILRKMDRKYEEEKAILEIEAKQGSTNKLQKLNLMENLPMKNHRSLYIPRTCLPIINGFLSGLCNISIKILMLCLITFDDADNFQNPFTWFVLIFSPISVFLVFSSVNYSFHYFPQLQVVPTYLSSAMLFNIITGGICLNEFHDYNGIQLTYFIVGASMCVFGLVLMLYFDSQSIESQKELEFQNMQNIVEQSPRR